MNEAAQMFLEHEDYAAFCKAGGDNKTTICHVTQARWVQTSPTTWYFEITANRFLRNMVRAVVGTLIEVGRGKMTMEQFEDILHNGSRSDAGEACQAMPCSWKMSLMIFRNKKSRLKNSLIQRRVSSSGFLIVQPRSFG